MDQDKAVALLHSSMPTAGELLTLGCVLRSIDAGREVNPTFADDIRSLATKLQALKAYDSRW